MCTGAAAITLSPDYADDLAGLVKHSKKMGLEPIVMVDTFEHAQIALVKFGIPVRALLLAISNISPPASHFSLSLYFSWGPN